MTSRKEDAAALLGKPELLGVQHLPRHAVPELPQGVENGLEVAAVVGVQQPDDVLQQHPPRAQRANGSGKVEEQPGPLPGEADPAGGIGGGQILTGEPAREQVHQRARLRGPPIDRGPDVIVTRHLREVTGQHTTAGGIDLDLADTAHSLALQGQVEPADSSER